MAPPEPEWMLWAKRLRDENKILFQRFDSKPDPSALEHLTEEVRSLASTIQHLQQDNQTLRQRMQELERNVELREQDMCGKVEGLGRSMAEIYTELNSMVDVVEVIREGAGGLAYYQRRGRRQSSRPLPLQWERGTKITYRARTASSRAFSQMTTTDESNLPEHQQPEPRKPQNQNQHSPAHSPWPWPRPQPNTTTEQQQQQQQQQRISHRHHHYHHHQSPAPRTTISRRESRAQAQAQAQARDRDRPLASSYETIGIDPQGDKTLKEYFRDGASSVVRAMQLYEKRAAKAFVCGLRDKRRRMELWERLTERGWSWQLLRKEMQGIVEGEGEMEMGKGKGKGREGEREREMEMDMGKGERKVSMEL